MLGSNFTSASASISKRDFYKQDFYIHHPLFDRIIEQKLQSCLRYGQTRDSNRKKQFITNANMKIIQAPCIIGNIKTISLKTQRSSKKRFSFNSIFSRPKTTNTVIRSRTSEPRIRRKLQNLVRQEEYEQNLRPTLSSRYGQKRQQNNK